MDGKGYRRPNRQWKCGLKPAHTQCEIGPDARGNCESSRCRPRRTLLWWRGYLPVAFAVCTLSIMLGLYQIKQHRNTIAPGALSSVHAQLIHKSDDPHRCDACHVANSSDLFGFNFGKLDQSFTDAHSQTAKCMVCHTKDMPNLEHRTPHDLPSSQIEAITGRLISTKPASKWSMGWQNVSRIDWHTHQLACSDCHREHQGSQHDLQSISSQRCQACHQQQFSSFASNHPEFTDYPRKEAQHIAFDHQRHKERHFAKSNQAFDCRACHVDASEVGRVGQVFRSTSFEQACASCHKAPIESSVPDGIVVFQLPSLDVAELSSFQVAIGPWPEQASLLNDGELPPFLQLLLSSDEDSLKTLSTLPKSGNLADLDLNRADTRAAVQNLVADLRGLLGELARDGQKSFVARLHSTDSQLDDDLLQKLLHGIPPDLFRLAYREWFEPQPVSSIASKDESRSQITRRGSHRTQARMISASDDLLVDEASAAPIRTTEGSLLSNDPLLTTDPLLESSNPLRTGRELTASPSPLNVPSFEPSSWNDLKARQHLPNGGWMIDRQRMAIVYIPDGHADPWLTAYLTWMSQRRSRIAMSDDDELIRRSENLFDCLLPTAVGRCAECHSKLQATKLVVQQAGLWQAKKLNPKAREFTKFDHGPHLIQPALHDCSVCHSLDKRDNVGESPIEAVRESNDFVSITRQACIQCHREGAVGDHCTQCHNYHVSDQSHRPD